MTNPLACYFDPLPLIAVLRGITPEEIPAVGAALVTHGFAMLEVTLNSPQPFDSIGVLASQFGERCLVGAGTVTTVDQVTRVNAAGGRLIVMPHADTAVIREAKRQGMICVPGVATPTEAFAALAAGADGLKMFPAEQLPPPVLKAWQAVLPEGTLLVPVGGINPDRLAAYWEAGAAGFGTGSSVYKPGATATDVAAAAAAFAAAVRRLPVRPSKDRRPPARPQAS
jgi:2-dehydro-3-deoxyphosphogalactonate aldolase